MDDFFESHPDRQSLSIDEYVAVVQSKVGHDSETYNALLDFIRSTQIGEDILADLVEQARQRHTAMKLAVLGMEVHEGKKPYQELFSWLSSLDEAEEVVEEVEFVTDSLEELYEHNVKQVGLRWRLRTLNEMLGSLRKGDFGFIFARPESGKTTFLASEVSFFASQLEESSGPILWLNNEEQGEKVQLRMYQAVLGIDLTTLFSDIKGNQGKYSELTKNKVRIIDRANIYKREVEALCKRLKPSMIIFDQIDKIKGFDNDREDLRLGAIYTWGRELAKTYCPVIGVTQADGSGEGKKWLTMENVANAKTAKQAEADWILGIGKSNEQGYDYVRHLHLSKNKLAGDEDTIPELRHGRREVLIEPMIARYKDIV